MFYEYLGIPGGFFTRQCPACGGACTAEIVGRTLSTGEHLTNAYAACCACKWEGFADMTRAR